MKSSTKPSSFLRRNHGAVLFKALTLALGLSVAGTALAAPAEQADYPAWLEALSPDEAPAPVRAAFARVLDSQPRQTTGGTITVTSCANSGAGSLRAAVAAAASGDTIDLSQLTCSAISLNGQITIPQTTLTIQGKPGLGLSGPRPKIDATQSGRVFNHTGTGSLILRDTYLTNGHIDYTIVGTSNSDGGCVYSNGDVYIDGTFITFCEAETTSNRAAGGGVYAKGKITLSHDALILGNQVTGKWYAWGGGLYSGTNVVLQSASTVNTNSASVTGNGFARGGGIYAAGGIIGSQLTVEFNTAKAAGSSAQQVAGGGIYTGTVWVNTLTVNQNHALGPESHGGGMYIVKGSIISDSTFSKNDAGTSAGGLYATDAATIKTSTISDNSARKAGGIYADAKLDMETSTVADNTATSTNGGGIFANDGLRLIDSNITGNRAENSRGGISAYGDILISHSTIANNTSPGVAGAGLGLAGGTATNPIGIYHSTVSNNVSSASIWGAGLYLLRDAVIKNSTVASNSARNATDTRYGAGISLADGVHLTLSSAIVSGNALKWGNSPQNLPMADDIGKAAGANVVYNIVGSHNMVGYSSIPTPADTIGQANAGVGVTGLDALADNGGPTLTRLPAATSLAIDNGTDNGFGCDQRRDGYTRIVGIAADIGATELQDQENSEHIFSNGFDPVSTSCN